MDFQDKVIWAYKGYFDQAGKKVYRENSKELCAVTASKEYIKVIELDIRKSKDQVLYCYHGSMFQYLVSLKIPRNFSELRQKYKVDSLKEILEVIPENKGLILDIKDRNITKEDLLECVGAKKFQEISIGATSVSFLKKFDGMPKEFVKFLFGGVFAGFYKLEDLQKQNFRYFNVLFPFQINRRLAEKARSLGIGLGCFLLFFRNKQAYFDTINKYGIKWVPSEFI